MLGQVGGRGVGEHCGGRRGADSESKTRGLGELPGGVAPSPACSEQAGSGGQGAVGERGPKDTWMESS
eukprot:3486458-Prorocentrum_lima.AAC.1